MDKEITIQIIQTAGIIITPLLSIGLSALVYARIDKTRKKLKELSQIYTEALFYRYVIDKYAETRREESDDGKTLKNTFWRQAKDELGMDSPQLTEPAKIRKMLNSLGNMDELLKQKAKFLKNYE